MLIQIHMLQNYAPSNLNRDDSGAPKDAIFGGVQRGRISSQAIKRSIRRSPIFEEAFKARGLLAQRTNRLPGEVDKALAALGADEATRRTIVARLPELGRKEGGTSDKKEESAEGKEEGVLKTKILVFLGEDEVQQIAEKLLALYQQHGAKKFADKKALPISDIESALQHDLPRSVDIAMFGRMTTSAAFEDVRAAVQVAHALSTNTVAQQEDYFTAVDDISGESGAGMIGTVEFNSNTYYKYFSVHWEKLVENLGGNDEVAHEAIAALLEAAALAQPTGKQNSFAAHNLPDFILVEVSPRNVPVSYANAFVSPAAPQRDRSLMEASVSKLAEYVAKVQGAYNLSGQRAYLSLSGGDLPGAARVASLADLRAWLGQVILAGGRDG